MGRTASLSWFTLPADLQTPSQLDGQLDGLPSSDTQRPHTPSSGSSSGSSRSTTTRIFLAIAAVVAIALWSSPVTRLSYSLPPRGSCNPFAEPGALYLNVENTSSTIWKPFDTTCPPSHLLPLVELILESDAIDATAALPWMTNRTVVLIGDSIERFSVDYFCSLMDGELSLIDLSHPFSPPPFRNGRDDLREDEEVIKTWIADGRPHWCRISQGGLNLNLFSFFMYGSANYAEFEEQVSVFKRPHYYAPAQIADRIDHWVVGTLAKAGLQADIVHFSSCLWDVMHWSEVDSAAAGSTDVVHAPFASADRLDWYRERLTSALDKVEHTFPTSTLVWRRGHDIPCGQFHVPCARNQQFTNVADFLIAQRRSRWEVDETGPMIRGHSDFYKDKVHPGEVFKGLWADVFLHRLRESYINPKPVVGRYVLEKA